MAPTPIPAPLAPALDATLSRRTFSVAAAGMAGALALSSLAQPLLALADDGAASEAGTEDAQTTSPWLNPCVEGNVTQDTPADMRDNFYLAVNKEWLLETQRPEGETSVAAFTQLKAEVRERISALLAGDDLDDHSCRQAQIFYQRYLDMDARNAAGVEPLLPHLAKLEAIESLDDVVQLCCDKHSEVNLVECAIGADLFDSSRYALYIAHPAMLTGDADELDNPTEYGTRRTQAVRTLLTRLLTLCGYSQEDADATVEAALALDAELNAACLGSSAAAAIEDYAALYPVVTRDELDALSPNFPLTRWLESLVGDREGTILCYESMDYLAKLSEVFVEERVADIRAWLICKLPYCLTPFETSEIGGGLFNQDWIDAVDEAQTSVLAATHTSVLETDAYCATSFLFSMAVGRTYCDNFCPQETRDRMAGLIDEVVAVFRSRLVANTWLGKDTREKAVEKLDCLKKNVAGPDDWTPFELDGLDLESDEAAASLLDSYLAKTRWDTEVHLGRFGQAVGAEAGWSNAPQNINAFYSTTDNSINILAGILGGVFYEEGMARADLLGSMGIVIGHEITHAFDSSGSQFDVQGNLANWWSDEDKAAFDERVQAVKDYFSSIEALPGQYVNGPLVCGEATADLGATSCMLELARGEEDFDYPAFFERFARCFRGKYPLGKAQSLLASDEHPPYYLRVNANLQQFQEFYDTYGVVEGDGMYLPSDQRISVW